MTDIFTDVTSSSGVSTFVAADTSHNGDDDDDNWVAAGNESGIISRTEDAAARAILAASLALIPANGLSTPTPVNTKSHSPPYTMIKFLKISE